MGVDELIRTQSDVPDNLKGELEQAKSYFLQQHALSTLRAYKSDWLIFGKWCAQKK